MAVLPAFRPLFTNLYFVRRNLPQLSIPTPLFGLILSLSKSSRTPPPFKLRACHTEKRLGFKQDERVWSSVDPTRNTDSTIAAIVTSLGGPPGAVGIVRLSGPTALDIVRRIFQPARRKRDGNVPCSSLWHPNSHVIEYGLIHDFNGSVVDEVLLIPMLAPRSYTREDVIELQCHGSEVCMRRVLRACLEAGARLAEPGEFTLRAFLNGRLDLSQAENVGKLITAKSVAAADAALAGIQGGFSEVVKKLRKQCMELLTEIEARLDFEDEMPPIDTDFIGATIHVMLHNVETELKTANYDKLLQSGLQIAIVGRPNVGKSSLLNAWSRSQAVEEVAVILARTERLKIQKLKRITVGSQMETERENRGLLGESNLRAIDPVLGLGVMENRSGR